MIKVLTLKQQSEQAEELAEIYKQANNMSDQQARFLITRIMKNVNLNPVILTKTLDNRIVGFVYGFDFKEENWWAQKIINDLPDTTNWYENTFELNELMILPEYQSKGIGKELLTELKKYIPHKFILLGSSTKNIEFYKKMGYKTLVNNFKYSDDDKDYTYIFALENHNEL